MHDRRAIDVAGVIEPQRKWFAGQPRRDEKQDAVTELQTPPFQRGALDLAEVGALVYRTTIAIVSQPVLGFAVGIG